MNPKLDKLIKAIDLIETDKMTVSDFEKVLETFIKVVKELKDHYEKMMTDKMMGMTAEMYEHHEKIMAMCEDMESKVKSMPAEMKGMEMKMNDLRNRFISDLDEMKQSIPIPPDLTPINAKLSEIPRMFIVRSIDEVPENCNIGDIMIIKDKGELYIYE